MNKDSWYTIIVLKHNRKVMQMPQNIYQCYVLIQYKSSTVTEDILNYRN